MRNLELASRKIKRKQKRSSGDDVQVKDKAERDEKNLVGVGKKKRRREMKHDVDSAEPMKMDEVNTSTKVEKVKKKKRKCVSGNSVLVEECNQSDDVPPKQSGKSKTLKKKKKNRQSDVSEGRVDMKEKTEKSEEDEVYCLSSGDEDCSKGMKKWLSEYHQSRPGLKVLQQRIDDFIISHEEKLEQEKKEKEALASEGGWTVVGHQRGRKKTTDPESGIAVGSAVPVAKVDDILSKKKHKEVGIDFYRFQKREAHMNEIVALQSKFEQDKKRIQQMRAARKFRPY
ncbi:Ribosomal RNA-processing protein 7 homolog A [Linum grandiflorum]